MAETMNFIWIGSSPLPGGAVDWILAWHTRYPDPSIVVWIDPKYQNIPGIAKSFSIQNTIIIRPLNSNATPRTSSYRDSGLDSLDVSSPDEPMEAYAGSVAAAVDNSDSYTPGRSSLIGLPARVPDSPPEARPPPAGLVMKTGTLNPVTAYLAVAY
jgi:hypothetical protein